MSIFKKSAQDEQKFAEFTDKVDKSIETLSPYEDYIDLSQLAKLRESFISKTNDFFREGRKLNIGIIGQVKAGKSSFLNTLLFDSKKVLPSAATPKTATLTKIEYSEENRLVIEYYSEQEWSILESDAKIESNGNEFEAAREIMKLCDEKGIIPADYISRRSDEFNFGSCEELMECLDDYVGENGKYTALVKNVTIYMNNAGLKDISVVDTPGLNDPIVSRTDKTRQFIELCDVVFFLSRASEFFDKNDMPLLTSQIPQKGVKKLIMICSRFDDGLSDIIYDVDSITEAISSAKNSLRERAKSIVKQWDNNTSLECIIESCKNPVFVSSMCHNMSEKDMNMYNSQENLVFGNINEHDDVDSQILKIIGNIDEVRSIYEDVIAEKDTTLSEKAGSFVPVAEKEYKNIISDLKNHAEKNLAILKTGDRNELEKQKKAISSQINGVKGGIEMIFGEMIADIERSKIETMNLLREVSRDCARLNERQGTETHVTSYRVSDSVWYKPSTWGSSHRVYSTYETSYTYIDANDALENIRTFSNDACSHIEKAFYSTVNVIGTKRKLLNVVIENFDTSNEMYDPGFFRLITEQTLNQIEFPVMKIDVSKEQNEISTHFSGEIRSSSERSELQRILANSISRLFETVESKFVNEISAFRDKIAVIKSGFSDCLLENINNDFNTLIQQLENKETEINNYENMLVLFKKVDSL